MYKIKVDMLDIKYIGINEVNVKINYNDLKKVLDNKTIYEINIIKKEGLVKIKDSIKDYKYIIFSIVICLSFIYFLSNIIFYVDIVTNDKKMQNKISNYLKTRGIKKYNLKKNYKQIDKIKQDILNKYKNEIDWIEIEKRGSKYIVRYEPRVITKIKQDNKFQNVISNKNAIIYSMNVKKGQIVKNRFEYVKKGDVIVSGYIKVNDKINDTVKAEGDIYGETWYKVKVNYPLKYKKISNTNNKKKVLTFNFFSKNIDIFDFNKYKNYNYKDINLLKNNILPISLVLRKKQEIIIYRENNNANDALKKAIKCAKDDILKKLDKNEYIKKYEILKSKKNGNYVSVELFFSVIEKISTYQEIEEYKDIGNTNE